MLLLGIVGVCLLPLHTWTGLGLLVGAYAVSTVNTARSEERFTAWLMVLAGMGALSIFVTGAWDWISSRL